MMPTRRVGVLMRRPPPPRPAATRRHPRIAGIVRSRRGAGPLVPLAIALVTVTTGVSQAVFVESAAVVNNSFRTATLVPPTGVTAQTTGTSVTVSWTATVSDIATGYRVLRASAAGGPYTQVAQVAGRSTTIYTEAPGTGTFYYVVRSYYAANGADWFSPNSSQVTATVAPQPYVFKSTTGNIGSSCPGAQRQRDMEQGFVPSDPEETISRTGGSGSIAFCSPAFPATRVLAAGSTTVMAYIRNTAGSSCTLTATLFLNGTTVLGSGSITIPGSSALSQRTWSFTTSGTTLSPGSRLNLYLSWASVKACDTTYLHYDGTGTNSRVLLPAISQ